MSHSRHHGQQSSVAGGEAISTRMHPNSGGHQQPIVHISRMVVEADRVDRFLGDGASLEGGGGIKTAEGQHQWIHGPMQANLVEGVTSYFSSSSTALIRTIGGTHGSSSMTATLVVTIIER